MITNNEKRLTEYELPNGITIIVTLQALKRLDEFFLRMRLDNGETEAGSALGAVLCSEIEIECYNHCTWSGSEDDLIEDPDQSEDDALENGRVFVCPECHTSWALLSANTVDTRSMSASEMDSVLYMVRNRHITTRTLNPNNKPKLI